MLPSGSSKLENQNEVGCLFLDQEPSWAWDQQFSEVFDPTGLFEYEPFPWAREMSIPSNVELNDFEEICKEFGMWDLGDQSMTPFQNNFNVVNPNPVMENMQNNHLFDRGKSVCTRMYGSCLQNHQVTDFTNSNKSMDFLKRKARYKSSALPLEEIQKYFDVPITVAAKELNVGLTVLKKRCRELNIARWPHRKIKSLKSLIHNVKELGLTTEIEMLEEHKRMVERIPEMELTERTKKLRQACFKANYKKRRSSESDVFFLDLIIWNLVSLLVERLFDLDLGLNETCVS